MIPKISEHAAIEKTIQYYIDGVKNFDTDLIRKAFHPDSVLSGYMVMPDGPDEGVFVFDKVLDLMVGYMESAPPVSETSPNYTGRILSIEVHGRLATALIVEEGLEGRDFINHFQIQKIDGEWLITSKVLVSEPAK